MCRAFGRQRTHGAGRRQRLDQSRAVWWKRLHAGHQPDHAEHPIRRDLRGGGGGGVFQSTNSGASWSAVNTGLSNFTVNALAIDPSTPSTLYAGTEGGGVFLSTNSGDSWSAVNTGLGNLGVNTLAIDPTTPSTLYAGTNGGVFAIQQVRTEAHSRVTHEGCAIVSEGTTSAPPWPLLAGCILMLIRRRGGWRRTAD